MMNVIEKRIYMLLLEGDDVAVAVGILQMFENLYTNEKIFLSVQKQNELMIRLAASKFEENVWDRLLSIMEPSELSEDLLNHFIENKISLLTLCHMELQDKWLMKLIIYDDAPLYMQILVLKLPF